MKPTLFVMLLAVLAGCLPVEVDDPGQAGGGAPVPAGPVAGPRGGYAASSDGGAGGAGGAAEDAAAPPAACSDGRDPTGCPAPPDACHLTYCSGYTCAYGPIESCRQ